MTTENKFREFWIRTPDGHFQYGTVTENYPNFLDSIHVIEIAAMEQLKAVIDQHNQQFSKCCGGNDDKIKQHTQDCDIHHDKSEIAALKNNLEIAKETLVLLESFGYITQFKYIKQALSEIGGEI